MARNAERRIIIQQLRITDRGMRIMTTAAFADGDGTMHIFPASFIVVALVTKSGAFGGQHIFGVATMGIVTRSTTVRQGRMDVLLACRLVLMTGVAEVLALGRKHLVRLAEMRVMTGGTATGQCGVNMLFTRGGIIVTLQAQSIAGNRQHVFSRPGMGIMTGGTSVIQGRMPVLLLRLVFMAAEAEGIAFLVQKFREIALVRAMTASASGFSFRVRVGLALRLAFMALETERRPRFNELESPLLAGVPSAGSLVA